MNTRTLQEITEAVDHVFHSKGYVMDHFELSNVLFGLIKRRYPDEKLNLYLGNSKVKFTGRGQIL
jgi:hypothetical protein